MGARKNIFFVFCLMGALGACKNTVFTEMEGDSRPSSTQNLESAPEGNQPLVNKGPRSVRGEGPSGFLPAGPFDKDAYFDNRNTGNAGPIPVPTAVVTAAPTPVPKPVWTPYPTPPPCNTCLPCECDPWGYGSYYPYQ